MVDFSLSWKLIPEIDIYWKSQTARVTAGTTEMFKVALYHQRMPVIEVIIQSTPAML